MDKLIALAEKQGLDKAKFSDCLKSGKFAGRVKEDFNEGASIGITGTPGNVLINNQTGEVSFKAGAFPFEAFKAEIEQMLK